MKQLRLLHIAICGSAVIMALLFGSLRSLTPGMVMEPEQMVTWIMLGVALSMILGATVFRTRISAMRVGDDEGAWVEANRAPAILFWALLEGSVAVAALSIFMGANPWFGGGLAAVGLGLLISQSPGTLAGH
jgi:hypothetical protein